MYTKDIQMNSLTQPTIPTGSGFESKSHYGSGFFQMRIKLPPRDSAGVVTAFYVRSHLSYSMQHFFLIFISLH